MAKRSGKGANATWAMETLPIANLPNSKLTAYVVAMGQGNEGELYVLTNGRNSLSGKTGKVFKLLPQ